MSDPTNEQAGAAPPENPPAGEAAATPDADAAEAQTQATPAAEVPPAQDQVAAATAQQPTAAMPAAAAAGVPPAPPRDAWYRRRWAVITGAVAAAAVLFLGGMAVGSTFDGHDRGDFRGDNGPGMSRDGGGQGFGHQGWGDSGQGMVPPGMDQGGQGFGHRGWDQDGDDYGYGRPQAPGTTPVPSQSTSPQALTQ
jgi:hypothetical protein